MLDEVSPIEQGGPVREDGPKAMTRVGASRALMLHAEAHVAPLRRHTKALQQLDEVRIGRFVVHDKPRVDFITLAITLHLDRVRMSANPTLRLEQRYLVGSV
jgi:hypothetical protein